MFLACCMDGENLSFFLLFAGCMTKLGQLLNIEIGKSIIIHSHTLDLVIS